jgi:DNA-binding response OmpR family regulator
MKNGYRLLVVEDDPALCESIADLLRVTGYDVDTAQDGEEAWRLLQDAPLPDAILLDLVLPRMSGDLLLDAMGELWPRPSVVLMTGMVPSHGRAAADILVKPFDVDELLSRLERACGASAPASLQVEAHSP